MSFTGNEDQKISFSTGAAYTKNYRDQMSIDDRKGGFFSKDAINAVLSQNGAVGLRIYFGLTDSGKQELVIVGTDKDENDIISDDAVCLDSMIPCPDRCGNSNILNSDQ